MVFDYHIAKTLRTPNYGRRTTIHIPSYPIKGAPGQFELAVDDSSDVWIGRASPIIRRSGTGALWAPVEDTLRVQIDIYSDEGTPTVADIVRLGNQLADYRSETGDVAALLRAGGGTHTQPLPWGYVHNAVAALMALGIFACITGVIRDRFIAARNIKRSYQGLCVACGYPSPASGVCPECGIGVGKDAEGPSGEASA